MGEGDLRFLPKLGIILALPSLAGSTSSPKSHKHILEGSQATLTLFPWLCWGVYVSVQFFTCTPAQVVSHDTGEARW